MKPVELEPGGTEVILLVEDEDTLRNFVRAYLESEGYSVLEAGNEQEAMEICRSYDGPIHVLITDIVMPGLGGVELARAALKLRPTLAVIFVSGCGHRQLDTNAIGRGHFLPKPFSFDSLARTVRSLLDKNDESA